MQPKIRWRESDKQELKRAVRNFNAKLSRIEKKNPESTKFLPKFWDKEKQEFTNRLSQKQMMDLIQTRKDFNNEIKALRKFSERGMEEIVDVPGSEYNIKTTKWQKEEMETRIKVVNRRRNKRLKEIQSTHVKDRGEETGYTHEQARMGNRAIHEVSPLRAFTPKMHQTELNWKLRTIRAESQSDYFGRRDEQLRENYIHGIKIHYDYESVKDVVKEIEKMPIKKFLEIFYANDITLEYASPKGMIKKSSLKDMDDEQIDYDYQMTLYDAYEQGLRSIWKPEKEVKKKQPKKKKQSKKGK